MQRIGCRKRALSTVVSGAILLSAVAIMGTFLVSWANSTLAVEQKNLEESYSNSINKISESLVIEHVWFGQNPAKFVNITVNNVGIIGLNVTEIKIVNNTDTLKTSFTNGGILPKNTYSAEINFVWTTSTPIDIFVSTDRGMVYQTQALAP